MNNNEDFFLKQMRGVSPIKKSNKVGKEKPKVVKKTFKKIIKPKIKNQAIKNNPTNTKISEFNLEQTDIKKNIKKGYLKIDKKIDFHGKSLLDSEERFGNTILECYQNNQRCLLFVTGKGLYKKNNIEENNPKLFHGVIRLAFQNWVKSSRFSKYILSYEKASIEHGGDGAFYVYLRKKKD